MADASSLTLQFLHCGAEDPNEGGDRNDEMVGGPKGDPVPIDWTGKRSGPATITVQTGAWPTGLYAARLTTDDGRTGFAPFVLRATTPGAQRQLVVLPTNTWQAYNMYDRDGDGWGDTWYAGGNPPVELDRPYRDRVGALDSVVPTDMRVPRSEPSTPVEAELFLEDALAHGHEGVVVKGLDSRYEAGRRGAAWIKVKRAATLDLVVLAAEWGHGRRQGKLSNLHLGARDPESGGFVMLGKTFKGLTDEILAWQTDRLLRLATTREGHVVHVRAELVVEIAFDGVQTSSRYPGGLALRFARVKGYRPDKPASEADTVDAVRALHERQG